MFGRKIKIENTGKFIFSNAKDALDKIHEIDAKNVKFEMKSFDLGYKRLPKYLIVNEKGLWYFRLC
jgi:hypothetical protein